MAARPTVPHTRLQGWAALLLCTSLCACQQQVEARWPAGTTRFVGALSRLRGTREGLWTFWFPNGELREQGPYRDGARVGRWKQWHSNGKPRSEGERADAGTQPGSPRTGYWRFWFENGELEAQGVFVRGLREGHWDYYLTDGDLDGDRSGEYHLDQILR